MNDIPIDFIEQAIDIFPHSRAERKHDRLGKYNVEQEPWIDNLAELSGRWSLVYCSVSEYVLSICRDHYMLELRTKNPDGSITKTAVDVDLGSWKRRCWSIRSVILSTYFHYGWMRPLTPLAVKQLNKILRQNCRLIRLVQYDIYLPGREVDLKMCLDLFEGVYGVYKVAILDAEGFEPLVQRFLQHTIYTLHLGSVSDQYADLILDSVQRGSLKHFTITFRDSVFDDSEYRDFYNVDDSDWAIHERILQGLVKFHKDRPPRGICHYYITDLDVDLWSKPEFLGFYRKYGAFAYVQSVDYY